VVGEISPSLRPLDLDVSIAVALDDNRGRAFQGPIPAGAGFVLSEAEANGLLDRSDARYADVVRPYLVGQDVTDDPIQGPRRYIIDFATRPLEEARKWPAALELVEQRVRPLPRDQRTSRVPGEMVDIR